MAHAVNRDGTKQLTRMYGISFLLNLVLGSDAPQWQRIAGDLFSTFGLLAYGRTAESEADRGAVRISRAAGYNPIGYLEFLKKLQEMEESQPNLLTELFSTHPETSGRIATVEREIAALPPTKRLINNTARFDESGDGYADPGGRRRFGFVRSRGPSRGASFPCPGVLSPPFEQMIKGQYRKQEDHRPGDVEEIIVPEPVHRLRQAERPKHPPAVERRSQKRHSPRVVRPGELVSDDGHSHRIQWLTTPPPTNVNRASMCKDRKRRHHEKEHPAHQRSATINRIFPNPSASFVSG